MLGRIYLHLYYIDQSFSNYVHTQHELIHSFEVYFLKLKLEVFGVKMVLEKSLNISDKALGVNSRFHFIYFLKS